jgi:transposase
MWCTPNLTPLFRERMNDILALYTEPLPEGEEVHCFDETPKQLLSTPHGKKAQKPGKPRRLDYEYKRNGRRNIFVAVAPFQGTRTVSVSARRTAPDTAEFLWNYCMEKHKDASRIHRVLDNLNTHTEKSLRKTLGQKKAEAFFSRIILHFTPYHASWLNMAELEINCLKAQRLKRRIGSPEDMNRIKDAIVRERNERRAKITWGFTKAKAREKFPVLYGGKLS